MAKRTEAESKWWNTPMAQSPSGKGYNECSPGEQSRWLFDNRFRRMYRMLDLKVPRAILFNEALLIAQALLPAGRTKEDLVKEIDRCIEKSKEIE